MTEAYELIKDLEPSVPQEYILKGVVNAYVMLTRASICIWATLVISTYPYALARRDVQVAHAGPIGRMLFIYLLFIFLSAMRNASTGTSGSRRGRGNT